MSERHADLQREKSFTPTILKGWRWQEGGLLLHLQAEWRGKRRHARIVVWCVRCPPVRSGRCTAMSPSTARPATQPHHKAPPQQASKPNKPHTKTPQHKKYTTAADTDALYNARALMPPHPPPLGLVAFSSCCPSHVHPMQQHVKATYGPSKSVEKSNHFPTTLHHPHALELAGHRSKSWDCKQNGKEGDFKQNLGLVCAVPPTYGLAGAPPCRPAQSPFRNPTTPHHTPPHHRDTCTPQQASKQRSINKHSKTELSHFTRTTGA